MRLKRVATASFGLLLALSPTLAAAQASSDVFDLLPDPFYVGEECATLGSASRAYPELLKEHAAVVRICDRYKVDGDGKAWLSAIQPHADTIRTFDPDSGLFSGTAIASDQRVPTNYKVYALFLTTSDNWVTDRVSYNSLFDAFKSFGDSIGDNRLAVWFRKRAPDIGPDVDRAKAYADRFRIQNLRLSYNDGPFLILTSKFPDDAQNLADVTILRLNGLTPENTVNLLNVVEQNLRTQQQIDKRALIYEDVKQKVVSTLETHPELLKNIAVFIVTGKILQSSLGSASAKQ